MDRLREFAIVFPLLLPRKSGVKEEFNAISKNADDTSRGKRPLNLLKFTSQWEADALPETTAFGGVAVMELVPHFDNRRRFHPGRRAVQRAVGGGRFLRRCG